jgi:hypothetical protein
VAFNIKAHHEVDKDLSMKDLAFRFHVLAEKLEKLPAVEWASRHFVFNDGGFDRSHDGNDDSDGSHDSGTRQRRPTN